MEHRIARAAVNVDALLSKKGDAVVVIDRGRTVYDAIALMANQKVGSVIVTDGDRMCGIFTERDYLRRIALCGRTSKTTCVGEVMTVDLHLARPGDSLQDCMARMTRHRTRHLPVVDGNVLVGLISLGDCVAYMCDVLSAENHDLYDYIVGVYPR